MSAVVEAAMSVEITVNDRAGVIDRYLPGGEYYGQHPYGLTSETQILEHLAWNCAVNNVEEANDLDGWADLADDAALMHIYRHNVETTLVVPLPKKPASEEA